LRSVLLLFLFAACTETVEVTVDAPSPSWEVYGVDTVWVTCHPARNVYYVELLIDSAVVGADTYPGPTCSFQWNVAELPEASVHRVQARAISGSREYLSAEVLATVGYRSRLLASGAGDSLQVLRPDGKRDMGFVPLVGGNPVSPRFVVGCESVVFVSQRRLYGAAVPDGKAQPVDSVANGIYNCDASPVSHAKVFDGYPAGAAHLFYKDWFEPKVQLTHDSDYVLIDSSRFTCIDNTGPVYSPDGQRIAYYRRSKCLVAGDPHEGETRQDVFVMNRSGTSLANLTPGLDNGYFSGLTWTFDGRWVLFREGTNAAPDRVLAANLLGHAVEVAGLSPVVMACSPTDSTLAYIDAGDHRLHFEKLTWTADTLYPGDAGTVLTDGTFGSYIDWVKYSKQ
jgi:hypothetical protein